MYDTIHPMYDTEYHTDLNKYEMITAFYKIKHATDNFKINVCDVC